MKNIINERELRKTIVYNLEEVKYLLLTEHQAKLMQLIITTGSTTTGRISRLFNITSQNASTTLKKLYENGYLKRAKIESPSGGCEYVYKSTI